MKPQSHADSDPDPDKTTQAKFSVGTRIVRNPETWVENDFDSWGRGRGIGIIVTPPFELDPGDVDVRWPGGRCFEKTEQLLPVVSQSPPPAE